MTRIVLLGARGMLATDLAETAPVGTHIQAFARPQLDVTDADAVARILDDTRPECVINASAYTNVDQAETDYERAVAVNGTAVGRIGRLCAKRGARVVHFSTDYVFPGDATRPYRENDSTRPLNAYGRSKLAGEEALIASGATSLVLRTQWLFGNAGKSFPRTMWDRAMKGSPTCVVADQFGRPTYTRDLAQVTWELILRKVGGVYHVTNGGEPATWFDVAAAVFTMAGAPSLVSACTSAEYPTPAARPAYSVLDTSRLAEDVGIELPPWREALGRFLDALPGGSASHENPATVAT